MNGYFFLTNRALMNGYFFLTNRALMDGYFFLTNRALMNGYFFLTNRALMDGYFFLSSEWWYRADEDASNRAHEGGCAVAATFDIIQHPTSLDSAHTKTAESAKMMCSLDRYFV